jgi:hypothetical protein
MIIHNRTVRDDSLNQLTLKSNCRSRNSSFVWDMRHGGRGQGDFDFVFFIGVNLWPRQLPLMNDLIWSLFTLIASYDSVFIRYESRPPTSSSSYSCEDRELTRRTE